jgi:predicted acylesterase/phospholipase RssA
MLDTLRRHCNFAWHNQGHGARLSLGATRVDTGKLEFFDSLNSQIGPAHALASGSLPPGFPATEINGKYYWDGGCVTNTPLQAVLDDTHETADLRVFMVDLWGAHGRLPTTMDGVAWRQKEIQYASRMDQHGTLRKYQKLFGRLLHSPECAGIHGLLHGWAEEVLGRRLRNIDIHTIEIMRRDTLEKENVSFDGIVERVKDMLEDIQKNIFEKARAYRDAHVYECDNYEEFKERVKNGGFFLCHWDGTAETEAKIKEETQATIRCVPFAYEQTPGVDMVSGKPAVARVIIARSY